MNVSGLFFALSFLAFIAYFAPQIIPLFLQLHLSVQILLAATPLAATVLPLILPAIHKIQIQAWKIEKSRYLLPQKEEEEAKMAEIRIEEERKTMELKLRMDQINIQNQQRQNEIRLFSKERSSGLR